MKASIPSADCDRSKATGDYGIFKLCSTIANDVLGIRNTRLSWQNQHSTRKRLLTS